MNRLADETSPYLRQHADNPVDWYAWGDEAFAAARDADKPVLLSVGYSSCHWCHVMAHESFEDPEVAGLMNELFVNVKVDREERPDVDEIYMEAVQAMTGQGGWPMTVFMLPDGRPFFGGTYFPREPRGGMVSFPILCRRIGELWRAQRGDVEAQAGQLADALGRTALLDPGDEVPGAAALAAVRRDLVQQHDGAFGGFGTAPKFPQAMSIDLLVRSLAPAGDGAPADAATGAADDADGSDPADVRLVVETTLDAMASGGIYDHLGGGFARYSVDRAWLVPHFEKMLYDQALLTRAYLHAWQITGLDRYRQVVDETIGYVLRDLRHADGGFYSAEDADSEGEEGRFYVWTPDEVVAALDGDTDLAGEVMAFYGVTPGGNFEGRTILNRLAERGRLDRPDHIEGARRRLFAARERRVRPGLDDKVLTEWNGLMLATLAEAAAATGRSDWLDAAVANGEFLLRALRRDDGRWLRSWQAGGGARHLAFAADHGALVDAFVRLAEATGQARWIGEARTTADALLDLFWDAERGGVFTTGSDAERLITRNKDLMDNASPGANSLAAVGLLRLAALTGDDRYRHHADQILRLAGPIATRHPTAFGHLLVAVDLAARGVDEVVVTGDRRDLVEVAQRMFLPRAVLAWGEPYDSPLWAGRDEGAAYVCRNYACQLPAGDPATLARQLAPAA
ncbi:MAG TPA: thioredoxin domain-containing protein [Acidimicrobiales bacterium]|nr:thioredoxin domain-containing protein [Acidimicrobiales bacterium]